MATGEVFVESESVSIPSTASAPGIEKDALTQAQNPLYTDFTNDNPVANIQPPSKPAGSSSTLYAERSAETTTVPEKKPRVINFDQTRPFFCHVCQFESTDIEGFMRHSITVWHIKKTTELFSYKVVKREPPEKEEKKEPVVFPCQIMEKQGAERAMQKNRDKQPAPLMTYGRGMGSARGGRGASRGGGGAMRGGTHLAQVHGRKPYEKPVHTVRQPSRSGPIGARDFAQYPEPLIGLEYVTEIQVTGQSPRYHCELCDAKFDHNLKFPHLVGAKHRFNVLKEKNPQATQDLRSGIKKRSELTGKLLEEAQKLEHQEGRQQVKTRVEKSPFAAVNDSFNRNTRGRGSARGDFSRGRGAIRGGGSSSRGVGSTGRGQSYGQKPQQFGGARGGGRGRGSSWTGRSNSSWEQQFLEDPIESHASYTTNVAEYGQNYSQGDRMAMLPAAAFQKRSPPRTYPGTEYQMYYNPPIDQINHSQHGGQMFSQQINPPQIMQMSVAPAVQHLDTSRMPYNHENEKAAPPATDAQPASTSLLQEALGDLSKLVSSEEDASVALQVSNALTHALLTFRMKQMPEEEGVASTSSDTRPTTGF